MHPVICLWARFAVFGAGPQNGKRLPETSLGNVVSTACDFLWHQSRFYVHICVLFLDAVCRFTNCRYHRHSRDETPPIAIIPFMASIRFIIMLTTAVATARAQPPAYTTCLCLFLTFTPGRGISDGPAPIGFYLLVYGSNRLEIKT